MKKDTFPTEMPRWLTIGMRGEELPTGATDEEKADVMKELGVNARVLRRFTQLVRFVKEHYPEAIYDPTNPIKARSSSVEELLMLHGLSPAKADQIAHDCLKGNMKMLEIRQLSAIERAKRTTAESPLLRAKMESAAFTKAASEYILAHPEIFYELGGTEVSLIRTKQTLSPDLEVTTPKGLIAVEIRAFSKNPISSEDRKITQLIERVGVLQIRYYATVLVMPESNSQLCEKFARIMTDWTNVTTEQIKPVYSLLIPENARHNKDSGMPNLPILNSLM